MISVAIIVPAVMGVANQAHQSVIAKRGAGPRGCASHTKVLMGSIQIVQGKCPEEVMLSQTKGTSLQEGVSTVEWAHPLRLPFWGFWPLLGSN